MGLGTVDREGHRGKPLLDNHAFSRVKSPALLMNQSPDNAGASVLSEMRNKSIDTRIFCTMALAVAVAAIASVPFAPWRVTTGLLLGGLLSLVNHYWLISSTTAAFNV